MTRPSSGGFVLGFAAEIAIVVAAVSLLPRLDLSGGRTAQAASPNENASALDETSHYQRQSPPSPARSFAETQASLPPRLAFAPQPTPEPASRREPPPLIAVDPARPAYVEQRLDRASQSLVNGLGSYVTRASDHFLPQSPPPPPPPVGSFATQPTRTAQPRPWTQY